MGKNKKSYTTKFHSVIDGYSKYATYYDKKLQHLNSFEDGEIPRLAGDLEDKKLLILGAGTGREIDLVNAKDLVHPSTQITALDISKEMLAILRKKHPTVTAIEADMRKIPLPDDSQDIAIAAFAIVHLKALDKFFLEVYRVLKPGGVFILTNINQRKAPKLKTESKEEIVIESYYHIPHHVLEKLDENLFTIEKEKTLMEEKTWINQIIKAIKN